MLVWAQVPRDASNTIHYNALGITFFFLLLSFHMSYTRSNAHVYHYHDCYDDYDDDDGGDCYDYG